MKLCLTVLMICHILCTEETLYLILCRCNLASLQQPHQVYKAVQWYSGEVDVRKMLPSPDVSAGKDTAGIVQHGSLVHTRQAIL